MKQMLIRLALALSLALVAAHSTPAHASQDEAKSLYVEGKEAWENEDYQTALEKFTEAYQLMAHPGFLVRIGMAWQKLGNHEEAVKALEAYLEQVPDAGNREDVELAISESREAMAADLDLTNEEDEGYDFGGVGLVALDGSKVEGTGDESEAAEEVPLVGLGGETGDTDTAEGDDGTETAEASTEAPPEAVDTNPIPEEGEGGEDGGLLGKWWFWAAAGVVVVGAVGVGAAASGPEVVPPTGTLGFVDRRGE